MLIQSNPNCCIQVPRNIGQCARVTGKGVEKRRAASSRVGGYRRTRCVWTMDAICAIQRAVSMQRGRIDVADVPFVITSIQSGDIWQFWDQLGNQHPLDRQGKLEMRMWSLNNSLVPYLTLKSGLEARLSSSVYYEMAEIAELREGQLGIVSDQCFFELGSAE